MLLVYWLNKRYHELIQTVENYKIDLRKSKRKLSSDKGDEDEKLIT